MRLARQSADRLLHWRQGRALRRELDTYRPGRETEDLLASLDRVGEDQAAEVRDLLCRPSLPVTPDYRFMHVA